MKFLKKTFAYILPAMMVLGGATACTDFIEIDPENKVPEQGVDFTNKNNMYQPVVGAYSKVRTQGMHWCNALLMFTRDGDVWSGRTDDPHWAGPRWRRWVSPALTSLLYQADIHGHIIPSDRRNGKTSSDFYTVWTQKKEGRCCSSLPIHRARLISPPRT